MDRRQGVAKGSQRVIEGSPRLRAVLVAAGVELGEEGAGQGGGLPSWKRPCLIVPD